LLVTIDEFGKKFNRYVNKYIRSRNDLAKVQRKATELYKMEPDRTAAIVSNEARFEECGFDELYWVTDSFVKSFKMKETIINDCFTKSEIETFGNSVNTRGDINFPFEISAVQVSEDQWIGVIDSEMLIKLRRNGMIKYNKNIQRRIKTRTINGRDYDEIDINAKACSQMKKMFMDNQFIPNTITLNYNDEKSDIYYDKERAKLVVNSLEWFDIVDGYHRFISICQASDSNPDFHYTMELRITKYTEDKANQFIWQEEQKTHIIKKGVTSGYNMYEASNRITNRLNTTAACDLVGRITKYGPVDSMSMSQAIEHYYGLDKMSDEERRAAMAPITKDIMEDISLLVDNDPDIMIKNFRYYEVYVMIYVFSRFYGKDKANLIPAYEKAKAFTVGNPKQDVSDAMRRKIQREVEALIRKEVGDV